MTQTPFDIDFQDLPEEIPIFPLPGVMLLPRATLPLNIFEPRYLAMTRAALSGNRLIGMIQPRDDTHLFSVGCAGRITSFEETDDGRYLIKLKGVCRFAVEEELPQIQGFRVVRANWEAFSNDFQEDLSTDICREDMAEILGAYLDKMGMHCDKMENIRTIACERLISTLGMVCPFGVNEKQALLEAKTLRQRAEILKALLHMAINEGESCSSCPQ